ncbi:DUF5906 domain-containing protein [Acinetobacter bereziniae]|uniref:DUF5906 domain-containing protein n=1 Tax=Acinetobacter bereziniae TaxID=106648 RepID=UPI0021CD3C60|nr:DUF5906 domain-containing protein [Acinetobacter bereziniae]
MDQDQNMTQPQAISHPTDFNDLHLLQGLEVVKRQIMTAISSIPFVSPEPPKQPNSQLNGQIEKNSQLDQDSPKSLAVEQVEGVGISSENVGVSDQEKSSEDLLNKYLARFCLIEAETNVWDDYSKKVWKKSAFVTMLGGKKMFDAWNSHSHRKTISRDDVDGRLEDGGHKVAKEMQERFIMLEGKKACWDTFRRELVGTDVMKDNWAGAYELWAKAKDKRMIWHENLVFDPTMKTKEGQINTYDGMTILPLLDEKDQMMSQGESFEYCVPIISLLKFLCGREDEAYQWILKWLAFPLQHPGAKMNTSLLLCSPFQGAGKSLFFEKIMTRIYGEQYSVTLGQNGLESIYTDWAERKLYCLFEEIFNNKSKFGMMGLIKHMITGEKIRIEKKFMSGYSQNNHINCVFLSNEVQPLAIEERDRRFCVLEPNQKLPEELRKQIEICLEPDSNAISAFYTYLLNLDLGDFTQYTEPPMTKAKQKIIQFGLPGWKLFLNDWSKGELEYPFICCLSEDLYSAYIKYCHRNGEKTLPSNRFIELITSEKIVAKRHGRIYEDTFGGSYSAVNRKEVQRRIVFTQVPPQDVKQAEWLSSQVKRFRDTLRGTEDA